MELYPFQTLLAQEARAALLACKAVIIQLATGGGKTVVASWMISRAVQRGRRVLFLAHRAELLTQASNKLTAFGIEHGIIKAGKFMHRFRSVHVASVQTLVNRLNYIKKPGFQA